MKQTIQNEERNIMYIGSMVILKQEISNISTQIIHLGRIEISHAVHSKRLVLSQHKDLNWKHRNSV
jgi:hypothetical protein